jgi:alpha-L-rhamnosidase
LGLFQASINGQLLDDTYFNPGESDYSKTVYYVTYDITRLLQSGTNAMGIRIGNGQYVNFIVNPVMLLDDQSEAPAHRYQKNDAGYVRKGLYGDKKVIAQVEVTYADGRVDVVAATDDTWKWTDSPITFNNWYGGEDYDATTEIDGWDLPGTNRESWSHAVVTSKPLGRLRGREFHPVRIMEKFPAASVTKLANGNLLVDMGRNVAGFPELVLKGMTEKDRGTVIRMLPAEMLNGDNTGVDQKSCTQSWSEKYHCSISNSYTVKGTGDESWHPVFCYQGFQYVEVSGFPGEASVNNFTCCVLRVANEKTGTFETSDPVLNQINTITERAIESNMFFSFTDCPQIEKLGWLETTHLMFRSMAAGYDIRSWIPKIVQDMIDAQTDEADNRNGDPEAAGYMPAIAPEYHRIVGLHRDPNWGGACVLTPWEYYRIYGDKAILEKSYATMKRYMNYLRGRTVDGLLIGYAQMGDWGQLNENTPSVLVENCAYYYLLKSISEIAALLGQNEDAERFSSEAAFVKIRFHQHADCYQRDSKSYGNGSQASYGSVMFSGILNDENLGIAIERLREAVEKRDYHLSSGEVGLKQVFASLGRYGMSDVVYKMVMNDTQPSYKFFVDKGLTTLPEYWNYEELWLGTMVRSRNHAMMGHVKEWLTGYVLGIRAVAPGYRTFIIEPALTHIIKKASGSVSSPYGDIGVRYERNEEALCLEVAIPVGAVADIQMPLVGEGVLSSEDAEFRATFRGTTCTIHNVGSGNYTFTMR